MRQAINSLLARARNDSTSWIALLPQRLRRFPLSIAREKGVQFVVTLRDDDLPGTPGSPQHSCIGMMLENVRTMASALGSRADALQSIDAADIP